MEKTNIAQAAAEFLKHYGFAYELRDTFEHGMEVMPDFFFIYNNMTGQSRTVILHAPTDTIFKSAYGAESIGAARLSLRNLGLVTLTNKQYNIRLPRVETFTFDGFMIEAQEYVRGTGCDCWEDSNFCGCCTKIGIASGINDSHRGNWKIVGDEIVFFDYEGVRV